MTFSKIGRIVSALVATAALGLGMTACGGGTIGYMWVLGTYYNQISGFKIDQYTGNLTVINHSPFSSNGVNPVSVVVKPGGRYIYVVNSGVTTVGTNGLPANRPSRHRQSYRQHQQLHRAVRRRRRRHPDLPADLPEPGRAAHLGRHGHSGNFLYVLDKYSHYYNGNHRPQLAPSTVFLHRGRYRQADPGDQHPDPRPPRTCPRSCSKLGRTPS